ncbi:MAG: hypothetical protein WCD72_01410 [Dehalococcoidia bacterium]
MNKEIIKKLLQEQKEERQHQLKFIRNTKVFYQKLKDVGFQPLGSLLSLIATWEKNLSMVEKEINELEQALKDYE